MPQMINAAKYAPPAGFAFGLVAKMSGLRLVVATLFIVYAMCTGKPFRTVSSKLLREVANAS